MEVLRYENVDISYNGVRVVRDISFSVREGEILGIAGESGSGKSTLIRAAMGLLGDTGLVTRGDIWYRPGAAGTARGDIRYRTGAAGTATQDNTRFIHGDVRTATRIDIRSGWVDLPDLPAKELRKLNGPELGMIFQNAGSSFCPIRTVGAQMYEAMTEHGSVSRQEFRKKALELFEKLGFEDGQRILDSYPFELSGGMQQRVGIAAAMLLQPKVLFADEPTSALDVSVRKQVVEEMLSVREHFGTTIILVTHNIGVIGAMADRVLVMRSGEMVEFGDKEQILNHPQADYTKRLMAAVPRLVR